MSIEERLRRHLHARAESIEVEARAVRTQRVRRLVPALAAAVVILVAVGGTAYLVGGGDRGAIPGEGVAADPTTATTVAATSLSAPSAFDVKATAFVAGAAGRDRPVWVTRLGDGYLAAAPDSEVSGAPADVVRIWVSSDGNDWAEMDEPLPTDGASAWVSHISSTGEVALVITQEFAFTEGDTSATAAPRPVAYTTQDGRTWQRQALDGPVVPGVTRYEFVTLGIDGVAAGPAGFLVQGTAFAQVDVERIAREEFGLAPGDYQGWMTNEELVEVTLVDGSTVSATYADLGITRIPGEQPEVNRFAWLTEDGTSWTVAEDLPLPVPPFEGSSAASASGFVVAGFADSGPALLASKDGRTWDESDIAQFGDPGEFLAVAGDGTTAVALTREQLRIGAWESIDGVAWRRLPDLPAGSGSLDVTRLAVGPLGVVAVITEWDQGDDEIAMEPATVIEKDGLTLRFEFEIGRLTLVEDATGTVLVDEAVDFDGQDPPAFVTFDDANDEVTINDPDTGVPLFTFASEDAVVSAGVEDEAGESAGLVGAGFGDVSVWLLADGEWQQLDLPAGAVPTSVSVGESEILFGLNPAGSRPGEIWRATPAG